ncbi:MAG TPA: outer-membrane lipoprotein carrier protein LolA [Spirochaetota bacterium]
MKKRSTRLFISAFVLLALVAFGTHTAFAIKFDFTTVSDVVKSVKKRYGEIECYSAEFKITSDKGGKKTVQQGYVKSKYPDKLLVEFSIPAGQRIVANDRTMWIYMPSLNVVAEQDLNNADASLFSGTKSGLSRLFNKFHYKFDAKDQPSADADGKKYYTLFLKQKESRSGYRTLKLWISEDYLIKKAVGETSSGKKVEIEFSNIKTNENFPNGIFKFDVPSQARVIKNPMMAEE